MKKNIKKENLIKYYDEETGEELISSYHIIEFVCNPNPKLTHLSLKDFCDKYGHIKYNTNEKSIDEFVNFNEWTDTKHVFNFRLCLRFNLIMLDIIDSKHNKEVDDKLVWEVQDLMKQMKKDPKFKSWDYFDFEHIISQLQAKIEINNKKARIIWFW